MKKEFKVGDTVKILVDLDVSEHLTFPVGTIGTVAEIEGSEKDILIRVETDKDPYGGWWYYPGELQKGHLEWVADE